MRIVERATLPTVEVEAAEAEAGVPLLDALALLRRECIGSHRGEWLWQPPSRRSLRELLGGGSLHRDHVHGPAWTDPGARLTTADFARVGPLGRVGEVYLVQKRGWAACIRVGGPEGDAWAEAWADAYAQAWASAHAERTANGD